MVQSQRPDDASNDPSSAVAQGFLDEVDVVIRRREASIDRRALGRVNIANGVITALFITVSILAIRDEAAVVTTSLLFAYLVWSQLVVGITERAGVQLRFSRQRWLTAIGLVLFTLVLLVVAGVVAFSDSELASAVLILPGCLALAGMGGLGAIQLWRARKRSPAPRTQPVRLDTGSMVGTIALGLLLAILAVGVAFPDAPTTLVSVFLVLMSLIAWQMAGRAGYGLPALGEAWRWPQFTAFVLSFCVLAALCVLTIHGLAPASTLALAPAGLILLLHIPVAFVGGRDVRR